MSSVNMFVLSGNLGAAPEERSSDLKRWCTFRLANNRWDTRTKTEVTDWYTILAFGSEAERCLKYLVKGSSVVVEGRVVPKEWEKEGQKHRGIDVIAGRVTFFGSPRGTATSPVVTAPKALEVELSASDVVPF